MLLVQVQSSLLLELKLHGHFFAFRGQTWKWRGEFTPQRSTRVPRRAAFSRPAAVEDNHRHVTGDMTTVCPVSTCTWNFPIRIPVGQFVSVWRSRVLIRELIDTQYLLTYGSEPFLRGCKLCSHSRTSQNFMKPESSLQCSQESSNCPYTEPDRSSPYHPILSP
jgi:hypothetical protein